MCPTTTTADLGLIKKLDDLFHDHKKMLWGLSYRMTGCAADADDIVQETFARAVERSTPTGEHAWRPWLMRVATNLSLDLLRQRRRRSYQGSWLPSPIETTDEEVFDATAPSTEAHYEWRESLSFAFLMALDALTPRQRAVLLLRDVFDYSARAAAALLNLSEENIRITHLRARRAMRDYERNRCQPTSALQQQTREVLGQFIRCLVTQDIDGATSLLAASARAVTDGGSEYTALHRPLVGRKPVLTLLMRVAQRRAAGARIEFRLINGLPAVVIEYASAVRRQAPRAVLRCELDADGHIRELQTILASRKLTAVKF
ncbi:MAG: sigma-70 family RNA polymerase sigma factor [Deltaproteobacteria bacterium]|nr:sigma-70 family RNA polymerase sigma factor [Deltaproteobacteria bacterium]